jgi:hypothetical protein
VSASPAERAAVASGLPVRVLVIDDEPNVRLFVCDLVEGLGYEADDAHDGDKVSRSWSGIDTASSSRTSQCRA